MIFRFVAAKKAEHSIKTMCRVLGVSRSGLNSAIDREADIRARLQQHWEASERGDVDAEHAIYAADAILDYPQSGERFRGRSSIQAQRGGHPAERHFIIRRILGAATCG